VAINIGGSFTYYYLARCRHTSSIAHPASSTQMGMVGQIYVRRGESRSAGHSLFAGLNAQQR
jgi:hypothetical protein